MRSSTFLAALALSVAACSTDGPVGVTPAVPEPAAIKYGAPDLQGHPHVGIIIAKNAAGNPLWRCTATLMSPTVMLTAGHCVSAPAATMEVWFDNDIAAGYPGNGYPFTGEVSGLPFSHPQYNDALFYLNDLGVVVLNAPVLRPVYGKLPTLDALDDLARARGLKDVTFTTVGYGLNFANPAMVMSLFDRRVATPHLLQINNGVVGDYALLLSDNAATGGTCFGDSGGPNFVGNSNVVAGVTSFAYNQNCAGTSGVYRVDRADDLNWLATFGLVP